MLDTRRHSARPNRRVYLQLRLDRWITSPKKPCYIDKLPLELLIEILIYTSCDITHYETLHRDPYKLPDTHWSLRTDDRPSKDVRSDLRCIADFRFHSGCEMFCHRLPWNWLEVTRVCKRWQDATHASAQFWSRIPLQTHYALSQALQRSGSLPLRLIARFIDEWQVRTRLGQSLQQLHRISEISLTGQTIDNCGWGHVEKWLRSPAPELRRLCLESPEDDCQLDSYHLFGDHLPQKLREVELCGFVLPEVRGCSSLLPPGLTSLTLRGCLLHNWRVLSAGEANALGRSPRTDTFFEALGAMPLLEALSITFTELPEDFALEDGYPFPSKPVAFPHLRRFTFDGNLRAVSRLLTNIDLPITASIALYFQHDFSIKNADPAIDVQMFLTVFKKHLAAASEDGAYYAQTTLDFEMFSDEESVPHAYYTFTNARQHGLRKLPERMEFRHYWDPSSLKFLDEISSFADSLCMLVPHNGPDVALHVSQTCPFSESGSEADDWLRCFASMDALTQLRLTFFNEAGSDFLSWLSGPTTGQQSSEAPSGARYPLLHSLELANIHVDQNKELPHVLKLLEHHLFTLTVTATVGDFAAYEKLRKLLGERLQWNPDRFWM
ncbi:hypothetical protein PENSPDRAFT_751102 [Peniophora sp. CONT]|nr:hypothetical protein PENSPDRAFT_751102 [Peniophora sp. CONT]